MDRELAKQQIKSEWRNLITGITQPAQQKVNGETSYICPLCGHGTHGDGLARNPKSEDGYGLKCFSCGFSGDIISLYQKVNGIGFNEALTLLSEQLGVIIEKGASDAQTAKKNIKPESDLEAITDFTKLYVRANKNIDKTNYHRGISLETLNKFYVGYIEDWKHPKAQDAPASPRLIIPVTEYSYTARDTRSELTEQQERYKKMKVTGKNNASWIFNERAITEAQKPIIVVEGEIDALSIIDVGGEAIGLGSVNNYMQLVNLLENERPAQPLILALDQDEAGKKIEDQLAEELKRLQIPFYRYNITGAAKDANEALLANRERFKETIEELNRLPEMEQKAAEEAIREEYKKTCAASYLQDFLGGITEAANTPAISTGFMKLDGLLDGGLYEGLYIMGAISSLGKTTFALQIIEQIAQQGQDVLIFSLEMSRHELIAKSISRLTFLAAKDKRNAKTTRGITAGSRYKRYSQTEKSLINDALATYKDYAQHIYIHEGIGDIGVKQIKEIVQKHIAITGNKPVVLIDYLQILAPYEVRASDKQNTDKATLELKRLSRDCKIPVIGISSFNRDNYTAPVNNASFKESGAIEYSADVLMGLQYEGMDYREGETDSNRQKRIRTLIKDMERQAEQGEAQKIQVKILKNRNGRKGQTVFDFYAMFNCFKEVDIFADEGKITEDPFAELRNKPAK